MKTSERMRNEQIAALERYAAANGIKPETAGQYATKNSRYYTRLVDGEGFSISNYDRVMRFCGKDTENAQ